MWRLLFNMSSNSSVAQLRRKLYWSFSMLCLVLYSSVVGFISQRWYILSCVTMMRSMSDPSVSLWYGACVLLSCTSSMSRSSICSMVSLRAWLWMSILSLAVATLCRSPARHIFSRCHSM